MGLVEVPASRTYQEHRQLGALCQAVLLAGGGVDVGDVAPSRVAQVHLSLHLFFRAACRQYGVGGKVEKARLHIVGHIARTRSGLLSY